MKFKTIKTFKETGYNLKKTCSSPLLSSAFNQWLTVTHKQLTPGDRPQVKHSGTYLVVIKKETSYFMSLLQWLTFLFILLNGLFHDFLIAQSVMKMVAIKHVLPIVCDSNTHLTEKNQLG